jgi:hypothetical protein
VDLDLSRRILERLLEDPDASLEDKVRAEQKLARQDWKFHRDISAARARLARADARGVKRFDSWLILSRIEREARHFDAAGEAAKSALHHAKSRSQTKDARIQLANTVLLQAMTGQKEAGNYDRRLLSEASADLSEILAEEPGHREASTLLLGAALLLDHGPTALWAWRSYCHIPEGRSAQGLMSEPGRALDRLLPVWQRRRLTRRQQEELVLALAQSRFFRYAALVARKPHSEDSAPLTGVPRVAEIVAYSEFLENVEELTNEFYRLTALRKENKAAYMQQWDRDARQLWGQLLFDGERPRFTRRLFAGEIDRRFGGYISFGMVDVYYGLAFGHRFADDTKIIRQYGHEVELRFVALDSMVSNFYTSWFWDGKSAVGGWAKPRTIYQVRAEYADGPFRAWRKVTDPKLRRDIRKKIAENSVSDDALASSNPYAYLPGLDYRLELLCLERLLESVRTEGRHGAQVCMAFVAEYERMTMEFSIFAHEGRHALDEVLHPAHFNWRRLRSEGFNTWSQAEKEFRAKLSEIAFAPDPQMAFHVAVLDQNIGDQTGHGQAGERIVKGIVEWMDAHRDDVAGLNANRPLLPQFDLLTFEQIRAAVRKMDPLASGHR